MSLSRTDAARRALRWLLPAAALALLPKCLACVAAYLGLGAALGLAGPELCGAAADTTLAWSPAAAIAGIGAGIVFVWRMRRSRPCTALNPQAQPSKTQNLA